MTFPAATLEDRLNILRESDGFLCAGYRTGQGDDPAGYRQSAKNRRNNGSSRQSALPFGILRNCRAVLFVESYYCRGQMPRVSSRGAAVAHLKAKTRARLDDSCSPGVQQLSEKAVIQARSQAG